MKRAPPIQNLMILRCRTEGLNPILRAIIFLSAPFSFGSAASMALSLSRAFASCAVVGELAAFALCAFTSNQELDPILAKDGLDDIKSVGRERVFVHIHKVRDQDEHADSGVQKGFSP